MGWFQTEGGLKDVNPNFEVIPEGEYDFQILPGAKVDDYGNLNIQCSIATNGEFNGRRVFLRYPDPDSDPQKFGWSKKAFKRLEMATGIDQDSAETQLSYAQRLGDAFAKFGAPIKHRERTNNQGEKVTESDVQLFKVRPAA